jgi:hypothetical protein
MLYTPPYIITMSKFRKMRWVIGAGLSHTHTHKHTHTHTNTHTHTHTQKDDKIIQCKILIRKLKRRYQFLRTCVARRIFKLILKQEGRWESTGLIWFRTGASGRIF